jgi:hypothetical protein
MRLTSARDAGQQLPDRVPGSGMISDADRLSRDRDIVH